MCKFEKIVYQGFIYPMNLKLLVRCFAIAIVLISFLKQVYGTTVVCIIRNGVITVGADSKLFITNFSDTTFALNCKIVQVDSFFIAFSGISKYEDAEFSISNIANNTLSGDGNFKNKISSFQDSLYNSFTRVVSMIRLNNPNIVVEDQKIAKLRCSVMVLGIDNTIPFVYCIQNKAINENSVGLKVVKNYTGIYANDSVSGRIFMGERDNIYNFISIDTTYLEENNPVDVINYFIGLEIEHSLKVGPPIDILQIDNTGGHWIKRKSECDDKDQI